MRKAKSHPRSRPSRHAALTVEVALVMPVFVLFLAAILEFGHYFLVQHVLNAAARRGAHLGSFEGVTNQDVIEQVRSIVGAAINADRVTVVIRDGSIFDTGSVNPQTLNYEALPPINLATAKSADCFVVQVRVPYEDVAVLPPFWIQNHHVTGRAVMRHE